MKKVFFIFLVGGLILALPGLTALESIWLDRLSLTLVAPDDSPCAAVALEGLDGATIFIGHLETVVTGSITNNFEYPLEVYLGVDPEVTEAKCLRNNRDEDWKLRFHLADKALLFKGTGPADMPRREMGPVRIGPGETKKLELAVYFEISHRARKNYSFSAVAYFDLAGYTEAGEEIIVLAHSSTPRYQYYESWRDPPDN